MIQIRAAPRLRVQRFVISRLLLGGSRFHCFGTYFHLTYSPPIVTSATVYRPRRPILHVFVKKKKMETRYCPALADNLRHRTISVHRNCFSCELRVNRFELGKLLAYVTHQLFRPIGLPFRCTYRRSSVKKAAIGVESRLRNAQRTLACTSSSSFAIASRSMFVSIRRSEI